MLNSPNMRQQKLSAYQGKSLSDLDGMEAVRSKVTARISVEMGMKIVLFEKACY